jgi:hypothetical protein
MWRRISSLTASLFVAATVGSCATGDPTPPTGMLSAGQHALMSKLHHAAKPCLAVRRDSRRIYTTVTRVEPDDAGRTRISFSKGEDSELNHCIIEAVQKADIHFPDDVEALEIPLAFAL